MVHGEGAGMVDRGYILVTFPENPKLTKRSKNSGSSKSATSLSTFSVPDFPDWDPDHSLGEHRFLSMGLSNANNLFVVSYTEKQQNRIRIINAGKATRQEQKYYEYEYKRGNASRI